MIATFLTFLLITCILIAHVLIMYVFSAFHEALISWGLANPGETAHPRANSFQPKVNNLPVSGPCIGQPANPEPVSPMAFLI